MTTSLYRIMYAGEWRPVLNMLRGQQRVYHPEQAYAVVIAIDGGFEAVPVTPGDVMTEWEPMVPKEDGWETIR